MTKKNCKNFQLCLCCMRKVSELFKKSVRTIKEINFNKPHQNKLFIDGLSKKFFQQ